MASLSSEVVGCLLNSNLHSRPCSVSGVLQPELVGAALSNSVADSVMDDLLESVVSSSNAKQPVPPGWAVPVVDMTKLTFPVTGPYIPVSNRVGQKIKIFDLGFPIRRAFAEWC